MIKVRAINYDNIYHLTNEQIDILFQKNISRKLKLDLIETEFENKFCIFDEYHLHKPIKQIEIIT